MAEDCLASGFTGEGWCIEAAIANDRCKRHQGAPVHTPSNVRRMPNQPRTPVTGFRIPTDLKARAAEAAAAEGKTLTDVVVESLERYVKRRSRS